MAGVSSEQGIAKPEGERGEHPRNKRAHDELRRTEPAKTEISRQLRPPTDPSGTSPRFWPRGEAGFTFWVRSPSRKAGLGSETTGSQSSIHIQRIGPTTAFGASPSHTRKPPPPPGTLMDSPRAHRGSPPAYFPHRLKPRGFLPDGQGLLPAALLPCPGAGHPPGLGSSPFQPAAPAVLAPRQPRLRLPALDSGQGVPCCAARPRGGPGPESPAASALCRAPRAFCIAERSRDGRKW